MFLPVWDVRLPLDEAVDDPSEREQRLVDLASLAGAPVDGPRAANVLAAGKVHQVELALDVLLLPDDALGE